MKPFYSTFIILVTLPNLPPLPQNLLSTTNSPQQSSDLFCFYFSSVFTSSTTVPYIPLLALFVVLTPMAFQNSSWLTTYKQYSFQSLRIIHKIIMFSSPKLYFSHLITHPGPSLLPLVPMFEVVQHKFTRSLFFENNSSRLHTLNLLPVSNDESSWICAPISYFHSPIPDADLTTPYSRFFLLLRTICNLKFAFLWIVH